MASAVGHFAKNVLRISRIKKPRSHELLNFPSICKKNTRCFHVQCMARASIKLEMPALSPTMTEGTIVKWYKQEGDTISPGDVLCDIQTDKAVVAMDIEEEGILAKILKPDNSKDIKIGTLIAMMVEEGDDWKNVEVPDDALSSSSESSDSSDSSQPETESVKSEVKGRRIRMSPSARKMLEEYDVNAQEVSGSGPHGTINKEDALKFIATNKLSKIDLTKETQDQEKDSITESAKRPVIAALPLETEYLDSETSNMRRTIAKRLTESKTTIPHSYVSIDCNMRNVGNLRKQIIGNGIKVSMNDFIIKAVAIALQRVPKVNSLWKNDVLEMTPDVDISVAVATDQGLITPIVKSAAHKEVDEISKSVKDLAVRAREGKLQLHEFQGGSFTISNLGMFGISEFSAVINPPQTAIMAVGGSRLVLSEDGKPQTNMTVTLSYDSRALDVTEASQFLEVFQSVMENPSIMVVGSSLSRSPQPDLV